MEIQKEIVIDLLDQQGPALSTTSDIPVIETKPDSVAVPDVVEKAEASPTETKDEIIEDEAASPESASETTEPKEARGVGKRLKELVKQREEAESKLEAERTERIRLQAALDARTAEPVDDDPAPVQPKRDDFSDPDAYDAAFLKYARQDAAREARREARREVNLAQAEANAKAQQDAIDAGERVAREAYTERKTKVMEKYADFNEVAETPDVQVSVPMAHAIINSPDGPEIQYYLGKNPAEAKRIMQLSPPLQLMELGLISAQLRAPTQAKTSISSAPKPIKPINGSQESHSKTPDEETMEEYGARRKKELQAGMRR